MGSSRRRKRHDERRTAQERMRTVRDSRTKPARSLTLENIVTNGLAALIPARALDGAEPRQRFAVAIDDDAFTALRPIQQT